MGIRRLLPALAIVMAGLLSACSQVPITGRTRLLLTSVEMENNMGVQAYRQVLKDATICRDAAANAVLDRVGRRIAARAHMPDTAWEFKLIESEQVNAFALPGGKVVIYTGILPVCRTEAGLAAVVGHEVSHVIARHGGERMSLALGVQLALTGAAVAADEWDAQTSALVLAALGVGANVGVMLPYSRKHEYEADAIGMRLMARAGYDPAEAPPLWERMSRLGGSKPPEILSTHPASAGRMETLRAMLPEMRSLYERAPQQYGAGVTLPGMAATK